MYPNNNLNLDFKMNGYSLLYNMNTPWITVRKENESNIELFVN